MKIFVTGTRGVPDIPGGVEKHCQELYPLLASMGHDVFVATRRPYVKNTATQWRNIHLCHIYAPRRKSLEAIVHTFLAVLQAWRLKVDIVHIHAVGPGLLVPLARLLGLCVVVTNHGPDYDRNKWGKTARFMLRTGEYLSGRFAHEVIAISAVIQGIIGQRCGREAKLICNGVTQPDISKTTTFLESLNVTPGKYILAVSRLVPEKGLHDLIVAFQNLKTDWQLVIAGDADHETEYSTSLKAHIAGTPGGVHTGYIIGEELNQVYSHAGLFVLPSYHEGLPIALLEALSYGLPVLVSDIPANLEVGLAAENYFGCGNTADLGTKIAYHLDSDLAKADRAIYKSGILEKYDWEKIAKQTLEVYTSVTHNYRRG